MPRKYRHSKKTQRVVARAKRRREREAAALKSAVRQEITYGKSAVMYRNHQDGIEWRETND